MGITFEMTKDVLIAGLTGELDHHAAKDVRQTIDRSIDTFQPKHLVLSFYGVTFMDSAGIGVVAGRYNKMKEHGGQVAVAGVSEYIDRILNMAGVYTLVQKWDDVDEAVRKLMSLGKGA